MSLAYEAIRLCWPPYLIRRNIILTKEYWKDRNNAGPAGCGSIIGILGIIIFDLCYLAVICSAGMLLTRR